MFKRNIKETLEKALKRAPVVLLNGARQVGKSTLALEFEKTHGFQYVTFDDELIYLSAKNDPTAFINNIQKPVIIDEVQRVKENFIDTIFEGNFGKIYVDRNLALSKHDLIEKMLIGGYPSVQKIDEEDRQAWMRSYLNLILQRDIKDLAQIEKITDMPNILKILAYQAANLLNVAEVSRDVKMVMQTVHRYIALLETIF